MISKGICHPLPSKFIEWNSLRMFKKFNLSPTATLQIKSFFFLRISILTDDETSYKGDEMISKGISHPLPSKFIEWNSLRMLKKFNLSPTATLQIKSFFFLRISILTDDETSYKGDEMISKGISHPLPSKFIEWNSLRMLKKFNLSPTATLQIKSFFLFFVFRS